MAPRFCLGPLGIWFLRERYTVCTWAEGLGFSDREEAVGVIRDLLHFLGGGLLDLFNQGMSMKESRGKSYWNQDFRDTCSMGSWFQAFKPHWGYLSNSKTRFRLARSKPYMPEPTPQILTTNPKH